MKNIYTLASAILLTLGLNAQIQESASQLQSAPVAKTAPIFTNTISNRAPAPEAVTIIWSDDFSNPSNWSYTGGADEWSVVTALSASLTTQGFDSVINSTSGGNFAFIDSDVSGQNGTQDAFIEYNGSIDCSTQPAVRLTFETYLRQYLETREVQVSNDGGTTWDTYDVLTQFGTNTNSPNAYTEVVDITATAGGQANVKVRFHYVGAWDWFWCVDDVAIVSAPDNDLVLSQSYFNGYMDSTFSTYYTMIPMRHADMDTVTFGAAIENKGSTAQPNTIVSVNVDYNGASVYASASMPMTSNPAAQDSVNLATEFYPTNGLGTYDIMFVVSSDSNEENPTNNFLESSFDVSTNEYRRDNDVVTSGNWYTVSSDWEMLSLFEINQTDTALAVSVNFPTLSNGRGIAEGDALSFYIYSDLDLENPVAKNEFHLVTASEVDGWVTLPMPAVTLAPGYYYAGFKIYNDNSAVGSNSTLNGTTAPLSVLVRTDATSASDLWSYTTSLTPFIRLYTSDPDACNGVFISITDTVFDNQAIGAINIGVTGGTPTYTYSWTGPNGYASTAQNPDDIQNQGAYTVVVTDVFGCTGTNVSNVGGIVTVNELGFDNSLSLFPNPNSGTFKLTANNVENGAYTMTVRNILGQVVLNETISANGTISKDVNVSNVENGVYFLELSNDSGNKSVIKFVVE